LIQNNIALETRAMNRRHKNNIFKINSGNLSAKKIFFVPLAWNFLKFAVILPQKLVIDE